MTRIQFWIVTSLSAVVLVMLISHIFLERALVFQTNQANVEQSRIAQAQQIVNQGQASQAILKQLALRIYQDSQKTQDQGLKDLMIREQITYTPGTESTSNPATSAPTTTAPSR